jgi:hypothetical protein
MYLRTCYAEACPKRLWEEVVDPDGRLAPAALARARLAVYPVYAEFCRDRTALALEKQRLNAVTVRSKNYVAKNVILR